MANPDMTGLCQSESWQANCLTDVSVFMLTVVKRSVVPVCEPVDNDVMSILFRKHWEARWSPTSSIGNVCVSYIFLIAAFHHRLYMTDAVLKSSRPIVIQS
jgi:hypothetical protein